MQEELLAAAPPAPLPDAPQGWSDRQHGRLRVLQGSQAVQCTGLYRVVNTSLSVNLPKELDEMEELASRLTVAGEGGLGEEVEKKLLA